MSNDKYNYQECHEPVNKGICNGAEIIDGRIVCNILIKTYKEGQRCPFYSSEVKKDE